MKEKKIVVIFCLCLGFLLFAEKESRPDAEGFITDWLICGPFPSYVVNDRDTGLETDCLGTDEKANPYPGLSYDVVFKADEFKMIAALDITNEWGVRYDRKVKAVWKAHKFKNPKRLDLNNKFSPIEDHFVYFGACWIESPKRQQIQVRLGSDDDNKVFLNGKVIGQSATCQDIRPDQFRYNGELKRGLNLLLVKIVDRLNDTGFCCRLTTPEGKPLTGIRLYMDSPARKLNVNTYDNGFGGSFEFEKQRLFDSHPSHPLRFRFAAPDGQHYRIHLCGQDFRMKTGESVQLAPKLKNGKNTLSAEIFLGQKRMAVLEYPVTVHSTHSLAKEKKNAQKELRLLNAKIDELERAIGQNRKREKAAEIKLEKARSLAEQILAKERASALEGVSEFQKYPFQPGAPGVNRTTLLLNGIWRRGRTPDRMNATMRLPERFCEEYFFGWLYPVSRQKSGWKNLEGYETFRLDRDLAALNLSFEKDFHAENTGNCDYYFVCDNVVGGIRVYCNNQYSGDYFGTVGIIEIPLKGVRLGKNTIRIDYFRPKIMYNSERVNYGLTGDIRLERRPRTNVANVWIRTPWRKGTLETVTELFNPGKTAKYRLEQYAIRNGMVCFRLPELQGTLPGGKTIPVRNSAKWKNPEEWSPKHPALYELVSDLYIDGKLTDRKFDSFGYREFRMRGVDFYLNGKRTIIQGDVGCDEWMYAKRRDVSFPLLRYDNINTIRMHDSMCNGQPSVAREADRRGMFIIAQMYPPGDFARNLNAEIPKKISTLEAWKKSSRHKEALADYTRWFRTFRNNPSVIVWSLDNELFTPGCESRGLDRRNELVDDIMDLYKDLLRSFDPELVITRDGDVCTYDSSRDHFDVNTPANVHYPDFKLERFVYNWQDVFEYRPVLWGENLYCSYVWGGWPGPTPYKVAEKAGRVRQIAGLYRKLGVSGAVYMGVSLDGYTAFKPDGSGSPWKVIETPRGQNRPQNWRNGTPPGDYPFLRIDWPADSGEGLHPMFQRNHIWGFGFMAVNWSSPKYATCVRNPINEAYRSTLIPQPPLAPVTQGEIILMTKPDSDVWTTLPNGERYGIRSDSSGRAWFLLPSAGNYTFSCGKAVRTIQVPCRAKYAGKPGFDQIVTTTLQEENKK